MARLAYGLLSTLLILSSAHADWAVSKQALVGALNALDEKVDGPPRTPPAPEPGSVHIRLWEKHEGVPKYCRGEAAQRKDWDKSSVWCEPSEIEVFDVWYDDCPTSSAFTPWNFCRCSDAQLSVEDLSDMFGRLPRGVRSHVRHIFAITGFINESSPKVYSAGMSFGNIRVQGQIPPFVLVHEAMHCVDASFPDGGFHDSPEFIAAYNNDTCVPDNYSMVAPGEYFAQTGVWLNYDTNGRPVDYLGDSSCMANQLRTVMEWAGNNITAVTSQCFPHPENDEVVPAGELAASGALEGFEPFAPPTEMELISYQ